MLKVAADVEKGNSASEHILQKFGFKYLKREEIPGSRRVILSYELSESEWENKLT